jgi:hypothetical protein
MNNLYVPSLPMAIPTIDTKYITTPIIDIIWKKNIYYLYM